MYAYRRIGFPMRVCELQITLVHCWIRIHTAEDAGSNQHRPPQESTSFPYRRGVAQDGEMGLLHPLCPLANPQLGASPIFQTVSLGNFGE